MGPTATPRMSIMLRFVMPVIPQEPEERAHLEEDLTKIGSIGLISKSWSVKDERMVQKLITGALN